MLDSASGDPTVPHSGTLSKPIHFLSYLRLYRPAKQNKSVKQSGLSARTLPRATLLTVLAATLIVLSTFLIRSSLAKGSAVSALPIAQLSAKAESADNYGKLPLSFESNEGQTDREVKFVSRGPGYDLFLTATGLVMTLRQPRPAEDKFTSPSLTKKESNNRPPEASVLRLRIIGANTHSHAAGSDQLPGKINYLVGDDPHNWHVNIPTYKKICYTEIYPHVDLIYYGNQTELEYDFSVAPGGNLQTIRFQLEGTDRMTIDHAGNLHLAVKQNEVTLRKPLIYQLTDKGERREVKGEYVIKGKEVGFKTGAFDTRKPLIIDPVLSYSTLVGGGSNEYARGIAVDSSGSAYITGDSSGGFPTTPGAFQTTGSGFGNAFVTKLDPTGTTLVYSTYLNGNTGRSTGNAIAIDSAGSAYVTGNTNSSDFPTVNPLRSSTSNFYKSLDSGGHWSGQVIGPPGTGLSILAVDPIATNTMYAAMGPNSSGGIYKTTDAGNNWVALDAGVSNVSCRAIAVDPVTPATLYASLVRNGSSSGTLYKSIDGGNRWTTLTNGLSGVTVSALAVDPSSPATVYAGSNFSGAFKSTDGGASWTNSSAGFNFGGTISIVVDPATTQTVYACAGGAECLRPQTGPPVGSRLIQGSQRRWSTPWPSIAVRISMPAPRAAVSSRV